MSPFLELKRAKYLSIRAVSRGADVTLLSGLGNFEAMFECADKAHSLIPSLGESLELGDGITECIGSFLIPLSAMPRACEALRQHYSVALVDQLGDGKSRSWALIWKIPKEKHHEEQTTHPHPGDHQ